MSEHVGRIPLVRRRRRRPPNEWECYAILTMCMCLLVAVLMLVTAAHVHGVMRAFGALLAVVGTYEARMWGRWAIPALRRWWEGG
jgi:hypothetical protein